MDSMTFITEAYSEDTGGGLVCDVLVLADRTVLVIGEESVVLYRDMEAWENASVGGQAGVIVRPNGWHAEPQPFSITDNA